MPRLGTLIRTQKVHRGLDDLLHGVVMCRVYVGLSATPRASQAVVKRHERLIQRLRCLRPAGGCGPGGQ